MLITTHGIITAHSLGTDEAGKLKIQANTIQVTDQGRMTTSAKQATGGDIHIATTQQLYLHNGKLVTSVMGGVGHGGNITINNPTFVILDQGQIVAQADEGAGGNRVKRRTIRESQAKNLC